MLSPWTSRTCLRKFLKIRKKLDQVIDAYYQSFAKLRILPEISDFNFHVNETISWSRWSISSSFFSYMKNKVKAPGIPAVEIRWSEHPNMIFYLHGSSCYLHNLGESITNLDADELLPCRLKDKWDHLPMANKLCREMVPRILRINRERATCFIIKMKNFTN